MVKTICDILKVKGHEAIWEEMGGVVERGLQIGAHSCLYKPFEVEQLIGTIEEISKRKLQALLGEQFLAGHCVSAGRFDS